jgi:polyphenol oxidase
MDNLPHYTSPCLQSISHAFFTRLGGVSEGMYASLNAGSGSSDKPQEGELLTLKQVHSPTCITVETPYDAANRPEADALVTATPGIILGILTADCVPVLLYDPVVKVIGAAHAGWKGALSGVIAETVQAMERLGALPQEICAAIGPSIAQPSYEVSAEFRDTFLAQDEAWNMFFMPSPANPNDHYLFDNKAYVARQLELSGVGEINILPEDTYADAKQFYSFRRATHQGEPDYGRQLSAIMI